MAEELTKLPEVASNVYAPCKKCETDRYHKVLTHKTPTSAQVQCEVCKKKSTFKLAKPKKPKSARKPKKSSLPAGPTWEQLKDKIGAERASTYSMRSSFQLNTAINHPTFGLGFVTLSTPYKIEVVFEQGLKALIHNKTA